MKIRLPFAALLVAGLMAACQPAPQPTPETPTPIPPAVIEGQLTPPISETDTTEATVSQRRVALCALDEDTPDSTSCTLQPPVTTTDPEGSFRFDDVEPGSYLLLYDSGLGEFDAAVGQWTDETLYPGDWPWLRDEFLELEPDASTIVHVPGGLPEGATLSRGEYGTQTLMLDDSPFIIAHSVGVEDEQTLLDLITIRAEPGQITSLAVEAYSPGTLNLAAERERIGELTREELALVDRELADRWGRFMAGEDAAYRALDAAVVEAIHTGSLHEIGDAYFTAVDTLQGDLIAAPGYIVIDLQTGQPTVTAWLDEASGDVIELSTGYRLNVRDAPGTWTETGPDGERFYHYGFSYYRRWEQILPSPIITLIENFYSVGVQHVQLYVDDYRAVSQSFGGELSRYPWYGGIDTMLEWQPVTAPFVHLPDSGTVDIRRSRFREAIDDGMVVVDQDSVQEYINSNTARGSMFNNHPSVYEVSITLLTPYYSGTQFSDLEALVILGATYGDDPDTPLTIRISDRLGEGFLVPRRQEKTILISPSEVADVLLGYPGALNSRWAHEMGHVIDFSAPQYDFTSGPAEGSRCEPIKYMMEFMWWVQRYPGNAPDWDWMPINSGLTLIRLLDESYHNSGC